MPQMKPLMWLLMMIITIISLMIISANNYFSLKPIKILMTKTKTNQNNWKW